MNIRLILVALAGALVLAGCASSNNTTTTPTPTATTPAATPTATPTPMTPAMNGTGTGVAAIVTLDPTPARAAMGTNVTVCWSVTGAGNVAHTAVHYDNVSHAGVGAKFSDYAGGAIYPGNTSAVVPAGYDLPGHFCAALPVPMNGTVYFRGHVIDSTGAPGKLSGEAAIVATGTATAVTVVSPPTTAAANSTANVCWHVAGSGNVAHTALHYDSASHPNSTSFTDYKGGAVYPNNGTSAAPAGYELPGTFCANLPVGTTTLYYRAHVIDAAGVPGRLSTEQMITIA